MWEVLIPAAASLFGANKAAKAAEASAQSNIEAAKIAAESAKFKPFAVTTGYGKSFFDEDKQTAGYEIDPRLARFRDLLYGGAEGALGQLELDPTRAAEQRYAQQMGLLQPQREAEDIALRNRLRSGGRLGYGVSGEALGAGAGTGMMNPEQYRLDLARSRSDQEMAANAWDWAQADIDRALGRGTGMMQTGFGVEALGMKPLEMGADIGNRAAVAGANAGQYLLSGAQNAARANLAAGLSRAGGITEFGKTLGQQDWSSMFAPRAASWHPTPDPIGSGMWDYSDNP